MNRREFLQTSANGALLAVTTTGMWAKREPPAQSGYFPAVQQTIIARQVTYKGTGPRFEITGAFPAR
jgi:hypothetical protein